MGKELNIAEGDTGIEIMDLMLIFMVFMMASLMTTVVSPVAQQLRAQAYTGLTDERKLNATPVMQWLNLISAPPYVGWIAVSLVNNGPNSVFIGVNNPNELHEVEASDSYSVNMAGAARRIEFLFYKCGLGERASVQVVGKY